MQICPLCDWSIKIQYLSTNYEQEKKFKKQIKQTPSALKESKSLMSAAYTIVPGVISNNYLVPFISLTTVATKCRQSKVFHRQSTSVSCKLFIFWR